MERHDGKTPHGGDYSELYMFDEKGNIIDKKEMAVRGIIRECKKDGQIISETTFYIPKENA